MPPVSCATSCADRLGDQVRIPRQATSVVAVGSGGTMAGLVAELGPEHVLGVHTGAVAAPAEAVAALASAITAERSDPQTLRIRTDQVGAGYGRLTEATAAAIRLAARTEGIVLDPTYTGRAMAGLIAAVRDGDLDRDAPVVFWHTGGLPGLFGHPEAGDDRRVAGPVNDTIEWIGPDGAHDGVVEREFRLSRPAGTVPAVLWRPSAPASQHNRTAAGPARARRQRP